MNKIAHRGNTRGRDHRQENDPKYILEAAKDHYVEVDVWYQNDRYYTGHDIATYRVDAEFLKNEKLFCHAKNIAALHKMVSEGIHCFWHEDDKVTLTSRGFIWKYPEVYFDEKLWGVCSDWL